MRGSDNRLFRNRLFWLIGCVFVSFLFLAYPLYVIRPFRYQGPRELRVALAIMRLWPAVEGLATIAALALAIACWRASRAKWQKAATAAGVLLVIACAALSRVNVYELMFHPLDQPSFSPANRANLDGDEKVIAVRVRGAARAYPIRSISYHHIVNDVAGGVPIVATY
jgi:hypothetical protein